MEIRTNEPMARHTSFRVGGPADRFMIPESEGELREAVLDCKASGKPWYMVGNGSNLLVGDKGFRGTIICTERLTELGGVRILMMHGHTRHVKSGPMAAMYAARECGADILLFGHTHQPLVDRSGDFWVMNPGCIGPSVRRTYGVITLEDGKVDCAAFRL